MLKEMSKNSYLVTNNYKHFSVDHYSIDHCMIIDCSVEHYEKVNYAVEHYSVEYNFIINYLVDHYLGYCLIIMISGTEENKYTAKMK